MALILNLTYSERLQTFSGFWDDDLPTARQLAAIGHICDRPPVEALDEGSHCITCSAFVNRETSVKALGSTSSASYAADFSNFSFHQPSCTRLQVRIPLEPQSLMGMYGYHMQDVRAKWERRIASQGRRSAPSERVMQSSSLFSLPTELRLEIYKQVLPELENVTPIVQLNKDSARVITDLGSKKPRDAAKLNILRTCRAVHDEAMDLLYSNTTFEFFGKDGTKVLYLFLRSIGQAGRYLIRAVDVQCGNREDAIAFALLASCEKLKSIIIRLPRAVILFPRPPIWCIDGMSCLLALRGLKEVTYERPDTGPLQMRDETPDAAIIRRELMRPKGTPGDLKSIVGYMDRQPSEIRDHV